MLTAELLSEAMWTFASCLLPVLSIKILGTSDEQGTAALPLLPACCEGDKWLDLQPTLTSYT